MHTRLAIINNTINRMNHISIPPFFEKYGFELLIRYGAAQCGIELTPPSRPPWSTALPFGSITAALWLLSVILWLSRDFARFSRDKTTGKDFHLAWYTAFTTVSVSFVLGLHTVASTFSATVVCHLGLQVMNPWIGRIQIHQQTTRRCNLHLARRDYKIFWFCILRIADSWFALL